MNDYYDLIDYYFDEFKREFGERKFRNITQKINSSNKIRNLLLQNLSSRGPYRDDITNSVMNIPYFMVAKKSTVIMGCLIVLVLWNNLYNKNEKHLKNHEMNELVLSIIHHLGNI